MDNEILNYKNEIEKINKRIKEYLWNAKYPSKFKKYQSKNIRSKFLE